LNIFNLAEDKGITRIALPLLSGGNNKGNLTETDILNHLQDVI